MTQNHLHPLVRSIGNACTSPREETTHQPGGRRSSQEPDGNPLALRQTEKQPSKQGLSNPDEGVPEDQMDHPGTSGGVPASAQAC